MRADREQQAAIGTAAAQRFQERHGDERAAPAPAPGLWQREIHHTEIGKSAPAVGVETIRGPPRELRLGESPRRLDALHSLTRPTEVHLGPFRRSQGVECSATHRQIRVGFASLNPHYEVLPTTLRAERA